MNHCISYRDVSRETFKKNKELFNHQKQKLEEYLDLLLWWNKRVNLVSRDVSRETVRLHIRHSLLLAQFTVFKKHEVIVDAGTGGGLPGIPLAVVSSEKQFVLNDIASKKMLAVKQIAKSLKLKNTEARGGSVADLSIQKNALLISKHAFKIDQLLSMLPEESTSKLVFYKGIDFANELKEINNPLSIEVYDLFQGTDDLFYKDKAIVVISKYQSTI